jgi:XTP/dITP diphosphohydrolase
LKLNVEEIQAETIEEVALKKAEFAYKLVKKPLIIIDAGFLIDAFNGFPGPYTKYAEEWFGVEGLLKLMSNIRNRNVKVKWSLVYCDGKVKKIFTTSGKGFFSKTKKGAGGNWFECLIVDPKTGLTLGEYSSEKERTKFWGPVCTNFAKWFVKFKK